MDDETIKENINTAVMVFKEILDKTYLENHKAFYGIGLHHFSKFFVGKIEIRRKENNSLRISGDVPAIAINENCKGLPTNGNDWDILPIIVTLFNKNVE